MKRHIGNIWVSTETYEIVFRVYNEGHLKNISKAVDEIVLNYINLSGIHERLIQEIAKLRTELKQEKERAEGYRTQLLTGVKP